MFIGGVGPSVGLVQFSGLILPFLALHSTPTLTQLELKACGLIFAYFRTVVNTALVLSRFWETWETNKVGGWLPYLRDATPSSLPLPGCPVHSSQVYHSPVNNEILQLFYPLIWQHITYISETNTTQTSLFPSPTLNSSTQSNKPSTKKNKESQPCAQEISQEPPAS